MGRNKTPDNAILKNELSKFGAAPHDQIVTMSFLCQKTPLKNHKNMRH